MSDSIGGVYGVVSGCVGGACGDAVCGRTCGSVWKGRIGGAGSGGILCGISAVIHLICRAVESFVKIFVHFLFQPFPLRLMKSGNI